ncbi:MAG: hypothetical protein QXJ19_04675 [Candidatus Bathyarchaeia archaeon]
MADAEGLYVEITVKVHYMGAYIKALAKVVSATLAVIVSLFVLYGVFMDRAVLVEYGLPGIFLVALLSHLSVVARGMFLPALLSLTEFYSPVLLGFVAGLGGALGETTAYCWGSGIRDAFSCDGSKGSSSKIAEKYGLLTLLLFASSPLPDTPIVLLLASLRLPLWKVILVQIVGKTILYLAGAYVGGLIFIELKSAFEYETTSLILLAASLILCIIVSWRKTRDKILKTVSKIFKAYKE